MNSQYCSDLIERMGYGLFAFVGALIFKVVKAMVTGSTVDAGTSSEFIDKLWLTLIVPILYAIYKYGMDNIIECITL